MQEIQISEGKAIFYDNLIEKWNCRSFENKEDENDFVLAIKELLDEDRNEMEFEMIIEMVNILTGCVHLKKF